MNLGPPADPAGFWQEIHDAAFFPQAPAGGFAGGFPAAFPDGRWLWLPIRPLPSGDGRAVASLILNQASFAVEAALVAALVAAFADARIDVIVGVPTLGLGLAAGLARGLGHSRYVALGTSRKFWYDPALSEPIGSITSPGTAAGAEKRIYIDPRLLPLLAGKRVAIVDDVVSSGRSMTAVLRLMSRIGVDPVRIGCAMLQGTAHQAALAALLPDPGDRLTGVLRTPILNATGAGGYLPEA